jgi:hypothetical protein
MKDALSDALNCRVLLKVGERSTETATRVVVQEGKVV